MSEVLIVCPQLKATVHVDDITTHVWGKNRELPDVTVTVFEKLKEAITKEELMPSLTERSKDGKSKMVVSCSNLKELL